MMHILTRYERLFIASIMMFTLSCHEATAGVAGPVHGVARYSNEVYELQPAPVDHTIADLNADGRPDLALVHRFGRLSIFLTSDTGELVRAHDGFVTSRCEAIAHADFDQDGDIDLAVLNRLKSKLLIFANDGFGNFENHQIYQTPLDPNRLVVADLENDGIPEIVVSCIGSNSIAIFRSEHRGQFQVPELINSVEHPDRLVASDLDSDGKAELIVSNFLDSKLLVLKSPQPGRWDTTMILSYEGYIGDLQLVDLDSDGRSELILSSWFGTQDGMIRVYTSDHRLFSQVYEHQSDAQLYALAFTDLDGDGVKEIAASARVNSHIQLFDYLPGSGLVNRALILTDRGPNGVSFADLDLDGDQDLITYIATSGNEHVQVNENLGNGVLAARSSIANYDIDAAPLLVDLNADAIVDLVWSTRDSLYFRYAISPTEFGEPQLVRIDGNISYPVAVDLDGDEFPELCVSERETETLTIVWNDAAEPFKSRSEFSIVGLNTKISHADFDGDGDIDLAVLNQGDPQLHYLSNMGGRCFEPLDFNGVDAYSEIPVVADFDGDQDLDIATVYNYRLRLIRNNGNAGFDTSEILELPFPAYGINAGDFDGDGLQDFFIYAFDQYVLLINQADGSYLYEPIESPSFIANGSVSSKVDDLDRDGDLDIVVYANTARVLTNTGFGEFRVGPQFNIGMWNFDLIDIDGDGDLDIEGPISTPSGITRLDNLYQIGCIADTNLDGSLSFPDVSLFIRLYLSNRPAADVNQDGGLDAIDVMEFINQYIAGCGD